MIKIRPITDLSKRMNEIEELCVAHDLPVFITKNGAERLVVMSHEHYEKLQAELELYKKLITAEGESRRGEMLDFNQVMDDIDSALKEQGNGERQISS
jgi:prevent-host-death family protein